MSNRPTQPPAAATAPADAAAGLLVPSPPTVVAVACRDMGGDNSDNSSDDDGGDYATRNAKRAREGAAKRVSPTAPQQLLPPVTARGADPFAPGVLHGAAHYAVSYGCLDTLRVLLAHGAALLGTGAGAGAGVSAQHARDSPHFTRRVARWDAVRRARIEAGARRAVARWEAEDAEDDNGNDDDEDEDGDDKRRAHMALLAGDASARRLAAHAEQCAEDLDAWAWARGQLDAVPLPAFAVPMVAGDDGGEPRPLSLAGWLCSVDSQGRCVVQRVIDAWIIANWAPVLRLLTRYGARLSVATIAQLLLRHPAALWGALDGADALPEAPSRADIKAAVEVAARDYSAASASNRASWVEPNRKELLAAFDACLRVRAKRISQGLKHAVPLAAHSTHNAPLDIVSEYIGFAMRLD